MKRFVWIALLLVAALGFFYLNRISLSISQQDYGEIPAMNQQVDFSDLNDANEEMRSVWFSYLDWNILFKGKDQQAFTQAAQNVLENLQSLNCNTLFLHVRSFGDAMYPSQYYPWSSSCSGTLAKDPGYDPLQIFIEQAHQKNIAVHAWVNPMRTMTDQEFSQIAHSYPIKSWYDSSKRSDYMMQDSTGRWILIPGNPEVQQLISNGVKELVENYDIDGIHMDDYFYPSGVDQLPQNDTSYFQKLGSNVGIEDWRRSSVTQMMQGIYQAAHQAKAEIQVGVSPQSSLSANHDKLFADVEQWVKTDGIIDYIVPQIYFGFQNSSQPFDQTAAQWNQLVEGTQTKLYIGLACYKIGLDNDAHAGNGKQEWQAVAQSSNDILKRQVECIRQLSNCKGFGLYDYKSIFAEDGSIQPTIAKELENLKSILG
ncbi:glycoside hydrolase family 10 protein [Massilioclostridium coli]|uniref:glycoside hydrolase family 10 protein n=1 Tax=Massilioclostridium coli TaxID=1870991 RepID=UPI00085CAFAB|nr:family 10 glycosylhydrolase [Massilioclostridium coli]